jgi:hypothetical protein
VRRAFAILSLSFAWFCANGALWDAVQVFAWARMVHDYSQFMPLARAIKITFDGSAPCDICRAVTTATQQEHEGDFSRSETRVLLACVVPERIVLNPPPFSWPEAEDAIGLVREIEVPVPPPRC